MSIVYGPWFVTTAALASLLSSPVGAQAASAAVNVASTRRVVVTDAKGNSSIVPENSTLTAAVLEGGTVTTPTQPIAGTTPGRNPYVGAQLGYSFNNTGDFASNLVASGSVLYTVIAADPKSSSSTKFFLPIRANFSALNAVDSASRSKQVQQLLSSAQGLRVGVEPYLTLSDWGPFIHPVLFGSAGWKINAVKDKSDTTRYVTLGRLSGGLELGIGPSDGSKLPITLDLAPVYSIFADRTYRSVFGANFPKSVWSTEVTIVLPVAANMGVLSEAISGQHTLPVWRVGLVLMATAGQ